MKTGKDIQMLIPESHRELIEAVPRGFPKSAVIAALLLGAVGGALLTVVVPSWLAAAVPATLLVAQRINVRISDKKYDRQMAELEAQGLDWKTEGDS